VRSGSTIRRNAWNAVDLGHLDELPVDRLQRGEKEDRHQRRHLPDVGHDHHPHRQIAVREPDLVLAEQAELGEEGVEGAVLRVVDPAPHERVDDGRQRPGQDDQRPEQPPSPEWLVHEERQREPEQELQRCRRDGEEQRAPDSGPEGGAGELVDVVAQADEGLVVRADEGDVEQAHPRRPRQRDDHDEHDDEGGGGDERRRHPRLGPGLRSSPRDAGANGSVQAHSGTIRSAGSPADQARRPDAPTSGSRAAARPPRSGPARGSSCPGAPPGSRPGARSRASCSTAPPAVPRGPRTASSPPPRRTGSTW
jgi:hypothetical protein